MVSKKYFLFVLCLLLPLLAFPCSEAPADSSDKYFIKVHFLYGSKPKHKFRATESKYFGGMHGGHVTIEVEEVDYGFGPHSVKNVHIFAKRKRPESGFDSKPTHGKPPYMKGQKLTTVVVPVSAVQYEKIKTVFSGYCSKTPYDYAFFGMRCAAAARDVLGQIGIFNERSNFRYVSGTFYPKKLRRRLLRKARKNNWTVIKQEGRATRKWERD